MSESVPSAPTPVRRGVGCFTLLVAMLVSALLGAGLALSLLWFGPRNLGVTFPDNTGRLAPLEQAQQTAVIERTEIKTTLREVDDLSGSVATLQERIETLENTSGSLADIQDQIATTQAAVDTLQDRINELESIPANAALAERIGNAENELATINATLDRLREAFSNPFAPAAPTAAPPTAEPTPGLTPTPTP